MRHMYSHPGEYRKIFLPKYLCIGFVPGGSEFPALRAILHCQKEAEVAVAAKAESSEARRGTAGRAKGDVKGASKDPMSIPSSGL